MKINKALELGLEWAEKRMASELTEMDKEYILTGIKASLAKNCSIPDVVGQSEQLKAYADFLASTPHFQNYSNKDLAIDYLDSL